MPSPAARGVRHVHFVGIGGAGMCGIAEVLLGQGYVVSGSDLVASSATRRLAGLGATVRRGHDAGAVAGADAVVVSSAIGDANVELAQARAAGIPVVARGEMLAELMRPRLGIAVAGSHGKTTTASLIAGIFEAAGLDPAFVIGALVNRAGANARLGNGRHFIAEADESDASFLYLQPTLAVITGIDRDHLDTYGQDFDVLKRSFVDFAHRMPFYGLALVCLDDPEAVNLLREIGRPTRTYGFTVGADYRATNVQIGAREWAFDALRPAAATLRVSVPLLGSHNVQNALAAVAVASQEGISDDAIVDGLASFQGVERRFAVADGVVAGKRVTLVDDYGHHPTEIARIIETARRVWPRRRLTMVYQPHRYTRTRDLLDEFAAVLADVDALLLVDVYAAGEGVIAGADGKALACAIRRRSGLRVPLAANPAEALARLPALVSADDVLVIQGAGDVGEMARAVRTARAGVDR